MDTYGNKITTVSFRYVQIVDIYVPGNKRIYLV
jgi:hypothetical protein